MVHKALSECVIVIAGTGEKDWNNQKVKEWILNASGRFDRRITEDTTHLVVTKKLWKEAGPLVQDVVARKKNGQSIKVVSQNWLEDSLQAKSKKKEKEYQYSIPGFTGKEDANGNPRSHTGLLKELFLQNTELTPAQEKKNMKQQLMEDDLIKEIAAEREREFQEHISANMSVPEQAAIFKRGAHKAKIIVGSNHHIYRDPTGFEFDVILTKVDTKHNTNERYNLVIKVWESNITPHTYGFTTTFSGTKVPQQVNHIIGIGANLPTTLRAFRKTFTEKTGIDWNDRIKVANDRTLREREHKRMKKAGLPIEHHMIEDIRFQKFSYYPPSYGSTGEVNTPPPQQQQQEEEEEDPARADFDAQDLAKFNEAQIVENEAGEKLDPMAAPYEYSPGMSFEELTTPGEIAGLGTGGGATQYMDLSSYTPVATATAHQQGYASPPPEQPEHSDDELRIENRGSVLGKRRKDSPVIERQREEVKKPKFDPETGDYIIEEDFDDEDGGA